MESSASSILSHGTTLASRWRSSSTELQVAITLLSSMALKAMLAEIDCYWQQLLLLTKSLPWRALSLEVRSLQSPATIMETRQLIIQSRLVTTTALLRKPQSSRSSAESRSARILLYPRLRSSSSQRLTRRCNAILEEAMGVSLIMRTRLKPSPASKLPSMMRATRSSSLLWAQDLLIMMSQTLSSGLMAWSKKLSVLILPPLFSTLLTLSQSNLKISSSILLRAAHQENYLMSASRRVLLAFTLPLDHLVVLLSQFQVSALVLMIQWTFTTLNPPKTYVLRSKWLVTAHLIARLSLRKLQAVIQSNLSFQLNRMSVLIHKLQVTVLFCRRRQTHPNWTLSLW